MFEPAGDAHQAVADAEFGALRWRQPLMRGRRRMRDQAFGIAEIISDADELQRVLKTERRRLAAVDFESDQRRTAAHLLLRRRGLWMVRAARINQTWNLRMRGKRHGKRRRRVGL